MNRRVLAGMLAMVCFSLGAVAFGPRAFAAQMLVQSCDGQLERCTDNGINTYDNCVCNVDPYASSCAMALDQVAPAPTAGSSVAACVAGLQLDLSKCLGQYIACKIIPGASAPRKY